MEKILVDLIVTILLVLTLRLLSMKTREEARSDLIIPKWNTYYPPEWRVANENRI